MKPLIPYFQIPVIHIPLPSFLPWDTMPIHGFGVLVAMGFLLGGWLSMRRAERVGLDPEQINRLVGWLVIGTFVGGHVGYGLMYQTEEYLADPRKFFYVWEGLSSLGGFLVCIPLAFYFFKSQKLPVWPYLDNLAIGLSLGWFLGRMGCTVAHDHPGTAANNFPLAIYCRPVEGHTLMLPDWLVQSGQELTWGPCRAEGGTSLIDISQQVGASYPGVLAAHDMGFYEALLALGTLGLFLWLDKKPRVPGFYVMMFWLIYCPARVGMDFLRPEQTDNRIYSLTPAQWGFTALFMVAAAGYYMRVKSGDKPVWTPPGTKPATAGADGASAPPGPGEE